MNLINILVELEVKTQRLHRMSVVDQSDIDVTIGVEQTHLGWEIVWIKPNQLTPYPGLWQE